MVFSTDKFMAEIGRSLSGLADDYINDMADDANIVARRLIDETDNKKALAHMNEISTLAEMCTNMKHDCKALESAFDGMFRCEHGNGKEAATGLDAMKIITEIGNDINKIAPHISWLFEDDDYIGGNIIQNIYNDSFFAPAEGQPV